MENELKDITKKSGLVFIGKLFGVCLGFLFNLIAARYIGAEIYGQFVYVYTMILFLPKIMKLGLDQGLVSFIPKLEAQDKFTERNSLISFSLVLTFFLGFIVILLLVFNSELIAKIVLNNSNLSGLVKIMAPLILFLTPIQISKGVFRGVNKIKYFIIGKNILFSILKLILLIFLSILGYKLYGLIISFYFSFFIIVFYLINQIKKLDLFGKIKSKHIFKYKELIKFSFPLLLTGILSFFVNKTDTFMIGYFLTDDKVGIYNIALRIGMMSAFVLKAFNTMFAPTISKLYNNGQIDKLSTLYKTITKWIVSINLVAFSIILIFSKEIMRVFGQEFIVGGSALILISIGQLVNAGVGSSGYINIMTGNPQYEFYNSTLTLVINVLLNFVLIPVYGIDGAAFASLVSVFITNIIKLLLVYKEHKIHPYNFNYLKVVASIVISFLLVFTLNNVLSFFWIGQFIGLSIFFVMIFVFSYVIMGLPKEDEIIIRAIFAKIKKYKILIMKSYDKYSELNTIFDR